MKIKFGLIQQIRRSSISKAANLTEGNARKTAKEKLRFITISYGSLMETYNHLIIAKDLNYLNISDFNHIKGAIFELSNINNGLRKAI